MYKQEVFHMKHGNSGTKHVVVTRKSFHIIFFKFDDELLNF